MAFCPYLLFTGDCADAFKRYHRIFGGEISLMTFADVPEGESMPGADPTQVMHVSLKLGESSLMGSDDPNGAGGPRVGSAVAYVAKDAREAKRVFEALADGGTTTMPFATTFWSKGFGMCTDRFGVPWMVDTEGEPAAA
jgi:PhnB protein